VAIIATVTALGSRLAEIFQEITDAL